MLSFLHLEKRDRTSSNEDVFLNSNEQINTDITLHRSNLGLQGNCLFQLPMLSFQFLLEFLLTQDSMLPLYSLLKPRFGLQSMVITEHWVVILPQHLKRQKQTHTHTHGKTSATAWLDLSKSPNDLWAHTYILLYSERYFWSVTKSTT